MLQKLLSIEEIESIESEVGSLLPPDVREKYLETDGYCGPSECRLLYPLHDSGNHNILRANMLKSEEWFPEVHQNFIILGDDGVGNLLCFDPAVPEAVIWNPADGARIQERRATVSELWDLVFEQYASAT